MPLDFNPPKVAVVIDKSTRTRGLVEASGRFALNLPPRALAALTLAVGTTSAGEDPRKLERCGVTMFDVAGQSLPLVAGCVGWLVCDVISEPHIEQAYDLFIGRVVAAWADERVFAEGRWHFENAPESLRTLHHVAGGRFYAIGEAIDA